MTPAAQILQAASDVRSHRRAVPGFSEPLAALLEACAALPETRGLALEVAHDIRPPRRRTATDRQREERDVTDYTAVKKALTDGAQPAMLCATCPWDRTCISPPTMTSAEIETKMAEAAAKDDQKLAEAQSLGKEPTMPVGSLLTALTCVGKDTSAQVCPVYALRLRSSGGRMIADAMKATMQSWDDDR